jgi:ATP-dependent DNA helicase RecQ
VLCATVAFGLGMDVSGITLIIHWDAARSLGEYMQQVGRGGRDGSQCLCITMYDNTYMLSAFRKSRTRPAPGAHDRRDQHTREVREV